MNSEDFVRIGIDARRNFGSGIGRVTSNLTNGLIKYDENNDYIIFVNDKSDFINKNNSYKKAKIVKCNIKYFSKDDIYKFPEIVDKYGIELFISPQFYISPFFNCRSIKMVHDLWPLLYPKWIPTQKEFLGFFGNDSFEGVKELVKIFLEYYNAGKILDNNVFLKTSLSKKYLKKTYLYMIGMMAFTLTTSTKIVIPSMHTFKEIKSIFPEVVSKVHIIPNFISPIFYDSNKLYTKKRIVLHVSKWEPRKNLINIIEGFKTFWGNNKNYKLFLVGSSGYRKYGNKILNLIAQEPYKSFIVYKNLISDPELSKLYNEAKVFLFPSLYEGFGIPIVESMASYTPVITSKVAAIPEVAGKSALYVDPNSPKQIANAINNLISDDKLYDLLVESGKNNIKDKYCSKNVVENWLSLINNNV